MEAAPAIVLDAPRRSRTGSAPRRSRSAHLFAFGRVAAGLDVVQTLADTLYTQRGVPVEKLLLSKELAALFSLAFSPCCSSPSTTTSAA